MKSRTCMPNLTPMTPAPFLTAEKFPTIDRCGQTKIDYDQYSARGFVPYRNFENESYKYIFPKEIDGIAPFAKKVTEKPFPDRLSVDEIDLLIREKLSKERYSLQELFKSLDTHNFGFISKEAFMRVLMTICKSLRVHQFYKLLERYDLNSKSVIVFEDFEKAFAEPPKGRYKPPVIFHGMGFPVTVTSAYALHLFREAAMDKDFTLKAIMPQSCFEGEKIVLMPQFREAMARIKIELCDEDFIRMWNRLDINGIGSIPLKKLLNVLNLQDDGTPMCGIRDVKVPPKRTKYERIIRPRCPLKYTNCYTMDTKQKRPDIKAGGVSFPIVQPTCWRPHGPGGTNEYPFGRGSQFAEGLEFLAERRPLFHSIMNTLSYLFEEPYQSMKINFERFDTNKSGFVSLCTGLKILCEYDYNLELNTLEKFLSSQGFYDVNNGMNYRKMMNSYQNKGPGTCVNRAIAQIITAQTQATGIKSLTTMSVEEIEQQLYKTLHKDFIKFQTQLENCSPDSTLILEKNLRKIIDKIIGSPMTEEQWEELQEEFEYDTEIGDENNRLVNFRKFLERFNKPTNICRYRTNPQLREKSDIWKKKWERGTEVYDPPRNSALICRLVGDTLKTRFHQMDKEYKTVAESNSNRLTKELLMRLLNNQKCRLTPQEMNVIWNIVEMHPQYNSLHYRQIIKYLMSNLYKRAKEFAIESRREKLAAKEDPNLKVLSEFRKNHKEQKENRKKENIQKIEMAMKITNFEPNFNTVQNVMSKMLQHMKEVWRSFKKQLRKLDVMGTTTIELFEMKDLLTKFGFNLTNEEMNHLLYAFDKKRNGRFHYIDFLTEITKLEFNVGSEMKPGLHFDRVRHKLLNKKIGKDITVTNTYQEIRKALIKKWKSLIRAFRKIDVDKTGRIDQQQLNSILLDSGIKLSSDDLYHMFTGFDTNLDGKIDYVEFIEQLMDVFIPNPN